MLSKFESITSIVDYLREPLTPSVAAGAVLKSSQQADSGSRVTKKQRRSKAAAANVTYSTSSPQSQSGSDVEVLPKGRVRYGPITVNPRKIPSKTLFTGRRSKYEVLSTDEEERRRDRRERNRVAATKCREKRENVLSELEDTYAREEQHNLQLIKYVGELQQRKNYLQSVLDNHPQDCPGLQPPAAMVFGHADFLSNIGDAPPPMLPTYHQPTLYQEEDERSHLLDSTPTLTNSAYDTDSSNGLYLPPPTESFTQAITMTTSSSIERLINSLVSPNVSMENVSSHTMLFNSAIGSTCAQQHSHSSDDDSMPPTRSHPYVC